MGHQFCTKCGAKLIEGNKFCQSCGTPVDNTQTSPVTPVPASQGPAPAATQPAAQAGSTRKFPIIIIAGIVVLLVIAAVAVVFVLPKIQDGSLQSITGQPTPTPASTPLPTPTDTPATIATTVVPTPPTDPFPDAYKLKELFPFNEGKYASRATVYRYWMNETYQWHNDKDNKYYTEPYPLNPNFKYLFVFVNIENIGKDGYPYPKSGMIVVHNGGNIYKVDTSHYLPDKSGDREATPVEILEIEQQSDYFNQEHVEDYGYSHGTTQDFVNPGQGNSVDGYLIYKVPASLKPEDSYVEIVFDGHNKAVWKLA
jgi:hypothetical protein